ncbi:MAG TPA: NAD-dependent epimerase/dehydratase family protein [Rhodocyclaceae bacterium]|nr:NAD-dependent epimerase/dehydratase family protein [Rhodocyclaceae bacterium]
MKVLVVGARGFIGGHVTHELRLLGYDIVPVDIHGTEVELLDPVSPDFVTLFGTHKPDVCVNCTGAASVPLSFESPIADYTLNTLRVAQMLDAIRATSPRTRYLHLSSAAVYGDPAESPVKESSVVEPLSPYGWHKYQAELICREYSRLHGVETISLRIFSAYGPRLRKQLFWDLMQKAKQSERVELFGTGSETRDFIYVSDLVRAIDVLVKRADFDARAVNVAQGVATTIHQAAQSLFGALGWQRELVFTGAGRAGDPCFWQADISYLSSLGFSPKYGISEGLREVADWMKSEIGSI